MTNGNRRHIRTIGQWFLGAALVAWVAHAAWAKVERPQAPRPKASITEGPAAPEGVARRVPTDLGGRLVLRDAAPSPMIRVLEGDRVSLTISNPAETGSERTVHFPDLAGEDNVTVGPIAPGRSAAVDFVARQPGLYSFLVRSEEGETAGLLLVEPIYGYGRADREYFVLIGSDGALPEGGLTAAPGERVRLFVGNGSSAASLRFDGQTKEASVVEDGLVAAMQDMQIDLEAGRTAILELDVGETGEVGVMARFDGKDLPRGVIQVAVPKIEQEVAAEPSAAAGDLEMTPELEAKIAAGKTVYDRTCFACHQATGLGIPGVYPPLAESDYLLADVDRAIHGVIMGQEGEITVNGAKYNMLMPPQLLNDEEIAQVVTYVMSSFGNPGEDVTVERVKAVREKAQ